MKMTFLQMSQAAENNPALKIVNAIKEANGTAPDGSVLYKWVFLSPPLNFCLVGDPIEPENVALLENLDYVAL